MTLLSPTMSSVNLGKLYFLAVDLPEAGYDFSQNFNII